MQDPQPLPSSVPDAPASHGAPAGLDVVDVDLDIASLDEIERRLGDVDVALRRLDDGTYGACETCGTPVEAAVLETSPVTRQCGRCAPPTAGTLFSPG